MKTGVAVAVGAAAYGLAMASLMSATMILPDGPVPCMPARETPLELARFWARGLAKILDPEATTGAETGAAGDGVGAAGVGVGAAA